MTAGLVAALRSPACYPHPAGAVEVLETHISWVLLAGDFAYKLKKPVRLSFVDFSTLDLRRHFCEEELRVNRRTAPQLYLGVVPITGSPVTPVVGGPGPAIEWAVRMRRFPQEALLDRVARAGALTPALVDAMAQSIAQFHGAVPRASDATSFGAPGEIHDEAAGNFVVLEGLDETGATREQRRELREWTVAEFRRLEPVFARRKDQGFVRECHGDLHLGNVALLDGAPVAFDAIEFNAALRWIDVMNDLAFPVMDLFHHGLPRLAHRFLDAWLAQTGDYAGLRVLRFYLAYRAMVRAKVSGIRAHQADADAAHRELSAGVHRDMLGLAWKLARKPPPALVVMHGLSGSGKTTVSQALLEALGAVRLRSDVERKRLHGLAPLAGSASAPGAGIYSAQADRLTYGSLAALAHECLESGFPVIVDATFLAQSWREAFRELAREHGAGFAMVACTAPDETLRARVERRKRDATDASEAGLPVLERQLERLEPLAGDELADAILVDTSVAGGLPEEAIQAIARRLGITPA